MYVNRLKRKTQGDTRHSSLHHPRCARSSHCVPAQLSARHIVIGRSSLDGVDCAFHNEPRNCRGAYLAVDILTQLIDGNADFEQKTEIVHVSDQKPTVRKEGKEQGEIQDIEGVAVEMCPRKE